jgi:hypothetical protein
MHRCIDTPLWIRGGCDQIDPEAIHGCPGKSVT